MKKIIDGRKYDTDLAIRLAFHSNNLPQSDFRYCEESIYRKKNGEFFLCGAGGAMSKYAVSCNDGYCGGDGIIPLDEDAAKEWCAAYCSVDLYESIFGTVAE